MAAANPPFTGEIAEQWTGIAGNAKYPVSYSGRFAIHADRLYIRTSNHVICVGHATRDRPADDPKLVKALDDDDRRDGCREACRCCLAATAAAGAAGDGTARAA